MSMVRAGAGHAGRPGVLPTAMLNIDNVRGDGSFRIDDSSQKIIWQQNQYPGFSLNNQGNDWVEKTVRALEQFNAQAVALNGPAKPAFTVANPEASGGESDSIAQDRLRAKHDAYLARMKLLKDEAVHDGYTLNLASELDFRQFIQSEPEVRRGNLVLMDNGNLRAIWKDGQGTHLGLQFLGDRMIQYVIFKRRKQGQQISRVAGRDSVEGIKQQIDAFGLHSLLNE
ncbi:MAG: hypothetical protein OXI88_18890 [Gammaproteobacteria bacterium]|nr:hypothetical protein [Gammaproteobacteria bacterium]MDE0286153.1 hypothetical protein [Gammaproteobacteria bacterium]MDE0513834.1 hypothetical protein [Gammaproteobacteria bacterium]